MGKRLQLKLRYFFHLYLAPWITGFTGAIVIVLLYREREYFFPNLLNNQIILIIWLLVLIIVWHFSSKNRENWFITETKDLDYYIDGIFRNAEYYIFIVSPYFNAGENRLKSILAAKKEGCEVTILVSSKTLINKNSRDELLRLQKAGCEVKVNPYLHSKIYLNEKEVLTGSINLLKGSFESSLEFGSYTLDVENHKHIYNKIKIDYLEDELTKDFDSFNVDVETPLAKTTGIKVDGNNVVIVPVLRAGLGMVDGLIKLIPNARIGYVGMERDEESHQPIHYYVKVPVQSVENKNFIIVDPMLATGGTAIATAKKLKQLGAKHIKFMCLIAAPEGVQNFCKSHPDIQVYTAALDKKLNDDKYIVPGLGDAGDRLFGTE